MKVWFIASEAVPLVKTGGLADVVGSLPKTLAKRGVDVRVVIPKYGCIPDEYKARARTIAVTTVRLGWRNQYCGYQELELDGVRYTLIDNEYYFRRGWPYGYEDEAERFVFFCAAAAEAPIHLGEKPDILHCHDWHAGLVPFLVKTRYAGHPVYHGTGIIFTIHNLKYQGIFSQAWMKDLLGVGDEAFRPDGLEFHGSGSFMKGGLVYADKLTTVSPTYAAEIQTETFGEGLDGLIRHRAADLVGILNGIETETYDPMTDPAIAVPYRDSLAKKRRNKLALQRELGLPESEQTPLVGIVSRLVWQKGIDLIEAVLDQILDRPLQMAVVGAGEPHYEWMLRSAAQRRPDRIAVRLGFDEQLARRIYAGSDLFLMPSRFEPCGLSQMIAMRYRSIPIVREVGGLKDTVVSYNEYTGEGNGFSFTHPNPYDMLYTIDRALSFYRNEEIWKKIVRNAAKCDFGWDRPAEAYMALYGQLCERSAPHRSEKESA